MNDDDAQSETLLEDVMGVAQMGWLPGSMADWLAGCVYQLVALSPSSDLLPYPARDASFSLNDAFGCVALPSSS